MVTFRYVITDKAGMHARPASSLMQTAVKLGSKITMEYNGNSADCKNLLSLMRIGVKYESEVEFRIEGESEENDAEILKTAVEGKL